jgi:hypothetical protein
MRKMMILTGLLALAVSALPARGQFFGPPVTNPMVRPPWASYGPYGIYPYLGNPAAVGPGWGMGIPTGSPIVGLRPGILPGQAQAAAMAGQGPLVDQTSANQTGHPVRWLSYQGYFMNPNATLMQGGVAGGSTGVAAGLNPGGTLNTGLARFGTAGKRPARGKENLGGMGP